MILFGINLPIAEIIAVLHVLTIVFLIRILSEMRKQ